MSFTNGSILDLTKYCSGGAGACPWRLSSLKENGVYPRTCRPSTQATSHSGLGATCDIRPSAVPHRPSDGQVAGWSTSAAPPTPVPRREPGLRPRRPGILQQARTAPAPRTAAALAPSDCARARRCCGAAARSTAAAGLAVSRRRARSRPLRRPRRAGAPPRIRAAAARARRPRARARPIAAHTVRQRPAHSSQGIHG